jgi:hypothetical protein
MEQGTQVKPGFGGGGELARSRAVVASVDGVS